MKSNIGELVVNFDSVNIRGGNEDVKGEEIWLLIGRNETSNYKSSFEEDISW